MRFDKASFSANLASPYGMLVIAAAVFMIGWILPPAIYSSYIPEHDYLFLDILSLAFFSAVILAFVLGLRMTKSVSPTQSQHRQEISSSFWFLVIPVLLTSAACLVYLVLIGSHVNFLALLSSGQGNSIKTANASGQLEEGFWGRSGNLLAGSLWWALYRSPQVRLDKTGRVIFRIIFVFGCFIALAISTATVNRTNLMPMIAGVGLISIYLSAKKNQKKLGQVAIRIGATVLLILGLFSLISISRGDSNNKLLLLGLMGYSIVSYNRLALVVSGTINFAYAGRGAYMFPVGVQSYSLNQVFGLSDTFGWPTPVALWRSEFTAVSSAGLFPAFNWASMPGYIFADIGWFALIYFFVVGLITGMLWRGFQSGRAFSVVMYPWVAFSVLFWSGYNTLLDARVVAFLEIAMFLVVWEALFAFDRVETRPSRLRSSSVPSETSPHFSPGGGF